MRHHLAKPNCNGKTFKSGTSQSWTAKEKFDVVNAILSDRRFTYAERVAAATMIIYFHNTLSGDLFPSREQVVQRCGVKKDGVISATNKMERFGYLTMDKSDGGRNKRNTYYLKKRSEKGTVLEVETVQKTDSGSPKNGLARVQKTDSHIPREFTQRKEEGEDLPSPRYEASSSLSKKNGLHGEVVESPSINHRLPCRPISTEKERAMLMKNPVLRSMFTPPADKALGDAEARIGVDVLTLEADALNWIDPESEVYRQAVAAEMKLKRSGLSVIQAAWEARKKRKIANEDH